MRHVFWRTFHVATSLLIVTALTACGSSPSMLSPHSPEARSIADTWWLMFAMACGVYVIVMALLLIATTRRPANVSEERRRRFDNRFVVVGGLIVPGIILGITAVATVDVANKLSPAAEAAQAPVRITVEGEQWWWRVDYPDDGVVTANEIHVPINQKVDIELISDNVIHSLWVPELNGKQDLVPGQVNHLRFTADRLGRFEGRCAEFCGIQHAHMEFVVFVDSADDYRDWLSQNRRAAATPDQPDARGGQQLFESSSCAGCHTIGGTSAEGTAGPDLTHVGSRTTLAAGAVDNTPDGMAEWLRDTQGVKPGARMPQVHLTDRELETLVAYLEGLR